MNLATRCLSCGTVFRVGEEQLLASDGWVRCGRCNGVFNAAEVLFDIDTGAPMRLDLPAAAPLPGGGLDSTSPLAAPTPDARPDPRFEPQFEPPPMAADLPEGVLLRAPSRETVDEPDEPIIITDHVPPPAPVAEPAPQVDDGPSLAPAPAPVVAVAEPMLAAASPALAPVQASPVQPAPSFLRQAERAAVWRQPLVRLGLAAGVVVLALGVLLQAALLWRDSLAAHLPPSAPALQALCKLAGCSVQPLRRIGQLAVESSGLNRLEGSPLYRLQLVLRNRADTAVMVPALDLTLTDPQGQLVARRVLPLAELGVAQTSLQPGQEMPIKVLMSTSERRVEGYTLELFYP